MVRRCACFSVMYFSQIHVNSFFLKKVTSLPGVAANQSGGKASGDGGLRLSESISRLPETILSMVTIRNLLRYAGTSLSYGSSLNDGYVAVWLRSCVQGLSQENTGTALQKEDYITQEPKLNGLKNRKNLRTTGFNLYKNLSNKGRRSAHSTLSVKEGMQTNRSFVGRSCLGEFFPIGKSNCIPLTYPQIINYFNNRIRGILNYYSCVHNRNELWSIIRFLNYSCALTLARKYKLKSLAKTFKRFGRDLKFVDEKGKEYKIFRPDNLRMLSENERFWVNENTNIDQLLSQSWSNSLTFSQFDEPCAICGTLDNIEIHHMRSVKDVRVKTRIYT